jgi:hypothetical protein
MSNRELDAHLYELRLSPPDAAQLLGVNPRTLRRWLEGEEVPGPAEAALRAWRKLEARRLPWRPDSLSIAENDRDQIDRHRAYSIELNSALERVEARRGPRLLWTVDRKKCTASAGPLEVTYYELLNGGFSLATYTRKDGPPDVERDAELIEDAVFCIAREFKRAPEFGPVTLVYHDGPWQRGAVKQTVEELSSNKDAIKRVSELFGSSGFNDPFVMVGETPHCEIIWDTRQLWEEIERRERIPASLRSVADDVRLNGACFARSGPRMLTPSELDQRQQQILAQADKIASLASAAEDDRNAVSYEDFEPILQALHQLGFFPNSSFVSAVAEALVRT